MAYTLDTTQIEEASAKIRLSTECDLPKLMTVTDILEPKTGSDSLIFFGTVSLGTDRSGLGTDRSEIKVVVKLTGYKPQSYNSLTVERQIYREVINRLILEKKTPCLVPYLGEYKCNRNDIKFSKKEHTDIYNNYINRFEDREFSLLITQCEGTVNQDKLKFYKLEVKDQLIYIFMICYTLCCFSKIGLRHNDLHSGNILIETIPKTTLRFQIAPKTSVEFETTFIPHIYDFDRGFIQHSGVDRNIYLDSSTCNYLGVCNSVSEKYDFFTFIFLLDEHLYYHVEKDRNGSQKCNKALSDLISMLTDYRKISILNNVPFEIKHLIGKELTKKLNETMPSIELFLQAFVSIFPDIFRKVNKTRGGYKFPPMRKIVLRNIIFRDINQPDIKFLENHRKVNKKEKTYKISESEIVELVSEAYSSLVSYNIIQHWITDSELLIYNSAMYVYSIKENAIKLAISTFKKVRFTRQLYYNYILAIIITVMPISRYIPTDMIDLIVNVGTDEFSNIIYLNGGELDIKVPVLE